MADQNKLMTTLQTSKKVKKTKKVMPAGSLKPIAIFIERFHITFVLLVVMGILMFAVIWTNNQLNEADITTRNSYTSPSGTPTTFDGNTLNQIDQLHTSDQPITPPAPHGNGRTNPFFE